MFGVQIIAKNTCALERHNYNDIFYSLQFHQLKLFFRYESENIEIPDLEDLTGKIHTYG